MIKDLTSRSCVPSWLAAAMIAARAAQEAGAKVILVLSIVDREEGAAEFYKKENILFEWLFTANEFLNSD